MNVRLQGRFFLVAALYFIVAANAQSGGLRIVVVEGEDSVNIIQQNTATAPVVEVRDRNNQPVAGAAVTFAIRSGRATFSGARTLTVTTNAAGRAAVTGLTPTGPGALQISASAAFQGQTATVTIAQTNVMTAAQGANASTAAGGGGSGGGIGTGTITAIGAGAAGGIVGYQQYRKYVEGDPPEFSSLTFQPNNGLQSATTFSVNPVVFSDIQDMDPNANLLTIDYGDGTVETKPYWILDRGVCCAGNHYFHVYTAPGTFTVRATYTDEFDRSDTATLTVTIFSLSGTWTSSASTGTYTFTQSGTSIGGSFTPVSGTGSGAVTGTVTSSGGVFDLGTITMTVPTQVGSTIVNATFSGAPVISASSGIGGFVLDPNQIRGSLTGPGVNVAFAVLTRR